LGGKQNLKNLYSDLRSGGCRWMTSKNLSKKFGIVSAQLLTLLILDSLKLYFSEGKLKAGVSIGT
jgi:hypothetical protein